MTAGKGVLTFYVESFESNKTDRTGSWTKTPFLPTKSEIFQTFLSERPSSLIVCFALRMRTKPDEAELIQIRPTSVLLCPLAVLDPRVDHTIDKFSATV